MRLEQSDIQALVISAYGHARSARFLPLEVVDPARARKWLRAALDDVPNALERQDRGKTSWCHLAFSAPGLDILGVNGVLDETPLAFREGMAARAAILGDDLGSWRWGVDGRAHVLLLQYSTTDAFPEPPDDDSGLAVLETLDVDADMRKRGMEHFGFRDGISQPRIAGYVPPRHHEATKHADPDWNYVAPGELILGYEDERRQTVTGPFLPGGVDLTRNGTWLVFRQIEQHPHAFWSWVKQKANGNMDELAARMVGRWRDGTSLTVSRSNPGRDPKPEKGDRKLRNDFTYRPGDAHGHGCPLGAHVRRANPRDGLGDDAETSLRRGRRRRLMRRGWAYGPPLGDLDPARMLEDDGRERGLHFIALNASIEGQFEFIQQTWLNNAKFPKQGSDPDPLVGTRNGEPGCFVMQADPLRSRVLGLPSFVTVRGGAYFLLPGLRAMGAILAD